MHIMLHKEGKYTCFNFLKLDSEHRNMKPINKGYANI